MIFIFNSESPTNKAGQNETEEGIIQPTAGYFITIHCSVNSGIPKETIVWKYNNTIMTIGGPAFFFEYVHPYKKR
jgi:hypothetical protein